MGTTKAKRGEGNKGQKKEREVQKKKRLSTL